MAQKQVALFRALVEPQITDYAKFGILTHTIT